jgi:hypothetical protein
MIQDKLIPMLGQKYAGLGVRLGSPPDPIAIIPAKHPGVGDVSIYDDGDEATISIGEITHGYFNPYDATLTQEEAEAEIACEVMGFLEDLFADKYLLWKARGNGGGGWQHLDYMDRPLQPRENTDYFVWSGLYQIDGAG